MQESAAPSPLGEPPQVSLNPALLIWRGDSQAERIAVSVRNVSSVDSDFTIDVEGLERGWFTLPSQIRIAAGHTFETGLMLHPPSGAGQRDYPYRVIVKTNGAEGEAPGWLSIPVAVQTQQPTQEAPDTTRPAQELEGHVPPDVVLSPRTAFRFGPGDVSAQAILTVHNRSKLAERFALSVEGLPEGWYALASTEVRLEPGISTQVPLRLTPRTGAGAPAGDYEFRARAAPQSLPEVYGEALGHISIAGVATFDARLAPVHAEGRKRRFTLSITNTGDLPLTLGIEPSDPEGRCRFKLRQPPVLEPGQQAGLQVAVGARRIGLLGPPETFDFRFKVTPSDATASSARTFDARFVHRPLVGFRPPFILAFMAVLALITVAIVFLAQPAVASGITWVGCQLDGSYRLSTNMPPVAKPQCRGGGTFDQDLDQWRRTRPGATVEPGLPLFPVVVDAVAPAAVPLDAGRPGRGDGL